jgi:hypothetical protein
MYIAVIGYTRKDGPAEHQWKRIGALWCEAGKAALHLRGFRAGEFCGKAIGKGDPPYIHGDLAFRYIGSNMAAQWLWAGRIYSAQEHTSDTVYYGTLEVMPCGECGSPLTLHVIQDEKGK